MIKVAFGTIFGARDKKNWNPLSFVLSESSLETNKQFLQQVAAVEWDLVELWTLSSSRVSTASLN